MKKISSHKIQEYIRRPDGEIDLHWLSRKEAIKELEDFILKAERLHWQSVKVITGKGLNSPGGVSIIKQSVQTWLQAHHYKFITPKNKEGGEGSLIVSLS